MAQKIKKGKINIYSDTIDGDDCERISIIIENDYTLVFFVPKSESTIYKLREIIKKIDGIIPILKQFKPKCDFSKFSIK